MNPSWDLALIDDDPLIRETWTMVAKTKRHRFAAFATLDEFLAAAIPKNVPIYIDFSLGEHVTGIDVAKKLHQLGFMHLHFATGMTLKQQDIPPFLQGVIGKRYPDGTTL